MTVNIFSCKMKLFLTVALIVPFDLGPQLRDPIANNSIQNYSLIKNVGGRCKTRKCWKCNWLFKCGSRVSGEIRLSFLSYFLWKSWGYSSVLLCSMKVICRLADCWNQAWKYETAKYVSIFRCLEIQLSIHCPTVDIGRARLPTLIKQYSSFKFSITLICPLQICFITRSDLEQVGTYELCRNRDSSWRCTVEGWDQWLQVGAREILVT